MKTIRILVLIVGIFLAGCAVGPEITYKSSRPNPPQIEATKVYVSNFKTARRTVAFTANYNIHSVLETVNSYDSSYEIALELKSMGINSEAVVNKTYESLKEGEVLLTGGALYSQIMRPVPWEIFTFFTVVPVVLPMPFTSKYGVNAIYNFAVIDSNGKYLYQTANEVITVKYGSHYWPASMFRQNPPPDFVYDTAELALKQAITSQFSSN